MNKVIIVALVLLLAGCYTKKRAVELFGCTTDSVRVDTTTSFKIDTFTRYIELHADTVKLKSPCEELITMHPGEKKAIKGKRTTLVYGKDTAGRSFIECRADAYRDSMQWYREQWHTTVLKQVFQTQKDRLTWWQRAQSVKELLFIALAIGFGFGAYLFAKR